MAHKYQTFDVTKIADNRKVMLDKHWLCKDGDPTQAIFYDETAQCNEHLQIVARMVEHTSEKTGWDVKTVFIPIAYKPQNIHHG